MRRYASAYERELRELLRGEGRAVRAYAGGLAPPERAEFERLIEQPYLVVRAAGSLGLDLVALRRDAAFPFEVKASSEATIRFTANSGRAIEQLAQHRASVGRVGLTVLYAYRRIGERRDEPWRIYRGTDGLPGGTLGILCRRLPPVDTTREGNAILRWESGCPLSQFLRSVRFLTEPAGGEPR